MLTFSLGTRVFLIIDRKGRDTTDKVLLFKVEFLKS